MDNTKVVVVGAGLAGLACAHELEARGLSCNSSNETRLPEGGSRRTSSTDSGSTGAFRCF